MMNEWEENYCTRISGYFQKDCEDKGNDGKDSWTICPMNKYAQGVKRGNHDGVDQMSLRCCEIDYHPPLKDEDPLPAKYKTKDGRVSFRNDNKHWIRAKGGNEVGQIDCRTTDYGSWEMFTLEKVDLSKGLFKIKSDHNQYLKCKDDSDIPYMSHDSKTADVDAEFQFFEKGDGVAIYHPWSGRFIMPEGDLRCKETPFADATQWDGVGYEMDEGDAIGLKPELFRTEMNQDGWGFTASATSPWFAFHDTKGKRWLKADKDNNQLMTNVNDKPGAWEKWNLQTYSEGDRTLFSFKSFHGKYLGCHGNGDATTDSVEVREFEKFVLFQQITGQLVIYNPHFHRYVVVKDGWPKCTAEKETEATVWYSGQSG